MIYILAVVLRIGSHEAIIRPVARYDEGQFSYPMCILDRDELSKKMNLVFTCMRESDA